MKVLLWLAIAPLLALAQGSGSIATPPSVSGSDGAPFRVTKSLNGVVQKIDDKSIAIEDAKTRKIVELALAPSEKLRVSGGKIVEGATVRINYAADSRVALDIRVLPAKKEKSK